MRFPLVGMCAVILRGTGGNAGRNEPTTRLHEATGSTVMPERHISRITGQSRSDSRPDLTDPQILWTAL